MKPGAKRTLVARLMAGAGCICGVLGFTMLPTSQTVDKQSSTGWRAERC